MSILRALPQNVIKFHLLQPRYNLLQTVNDVLHLIRWVCNDLYLKLGKYSLVIINIWLAFSMFSHCK